MKLYIRQSDTISPKLFTLALENIFNLVQWNTKGINSVGFYLNHHWFAEDIALATCWKNLTIRHKNGQLGDQNNEPHICLQNTKLENVVDYVYLGHRMEQRKPEQR